MNSSWGYSTCSDTSAFGDDFSPPPMDNLFTVNLPIPAYIKTNERYRLHKISIVQDFEERSTHILCLALFSLGYTFCCPIDDKSVYVITDRGLPIPALLKKHSLLDTIANEASSAVICPPTKDPNFRSAFTWSVFMHLLTLPEWIVYHNGDKNTGVVAKYDRDCDVSTNGGDFLVISLISTTLCEEDNISLEFDVTYSALNFTGPDDDMLEFIPTGENVELVLTCENINEQSIFLSDLDTINRRHGYCNYLPTCSSEVAQYMWNKWGAQERGDLVRIRFFNRLSKVEDNVYSFMLARPSRTGSASKTREFASKDANSFWHTCTNQFHDIIDVNYSTEPRRRSAPSIVDLKLRLQSAKVKFKF